MSYTNRAGSKRTTISVRFDTEDLKLLDKLAAAGYGKSVESSWGNSTNHLRARGPAIRQAVRDAAEQHQ